MNWFAATSVENPGQSLHRNSSPVSVRCMMMYEFAMLLAPQQYSSTIAADYLLYHMSAGQINGQMMVIYWAEELDPDSGGRHWRQ